MTKLVKQVVAFETQDGSLFASHDAAMRAGFEQALLDLLFDENGDEVIDGLDNAVSVNTLTRWVFARKDAFKKLFRGI